MKFFICLLFLAVVACAARQRFDGDKVFRIKIDTVEDWEKIQELTDDFELDFWRKPRKLGGSLDVSVPFFHLSQFNVFLRTSGLKSEILIDNLQTLIDQEKVSHSFARDLSSFDYNIYHNFEEIQVWIEQMAASYSFATKMQVGTSYEGRNFSALKLSTGPDRPVFVINCGLHAREWITPATCLYSAKWLAERYGTNQKETELMNKVDFVFIPSSNPDGYAYTHDENNGSRMWRKTRTPGNACDGVDPNRNWDSNFGGEGSSGSQCSETYRGPAPFSEPCTKAQKDFIENELKNVKMYMDVHSYGQMWMHSYGYKKELAENHDTLFEIAQDSVKAIEAVNREVYEPGSIATVIYVASGITSDYFYEKAGIHCSFTNELRDRGRYGFLLPPDQIYPCAAETYEGYLVMAQAIVDGKCDSRTNA